MIDHGKAVPSVHKLLADAIPLGIFLCDPSGRVSGWTGGAESLLGLAEAEVIGRSFQTLFRPGAEAEKLHFSPALFGRGSNYREVGFAIRGDGSEFLAMFTMDRVADECGNVVGYACTLGAL